jgi:hypothetical protein
VRPLGLALAAGGALLAVGGVAYAATRSSAPASTAPAGTTPVPGVPPAGSAVWVRTLTIKAGQTARISVPTDAVGASAAILGAAGAAAAFQVWLATLQTPTMVNLLHSMSGTAWGPGGPALPADWPPDDTNAASEYHAQFVYGETGGNILPAIAVAQIPLTGVLAWVPKGLGA